jgi:hypothetical protein
MKYGDFKAWKLAALIKERIGRAVRFHETVGLK